MHEINLGKYRTRTDIVIDLFDFNKEHDGVVHTLKEIGDILVDEIEINDIGEKSTSRKKGIYKTITFKDITDKDNFKKVEKVLLDNIKDMLSKLKIKKEDKALIIGLGNSKSTPDSLGPKVIDNTLVTSHLFSLGDVEEGYRNTSKFTPGVLGVTGIETKKLIEGIVKTTKPDFLIVIDALASSSLDRVNKVIQLTDTGIAPGSGIGNNREGIYKDTFDIPVIAIGVPTVVDAATIVYDTLKYMERKFSYKLDNINNKSLKFVDEMHQNYLKNSRELKKHEKEEILGIVGTLKEKDMKKLLLEVLSPINFNLMVTPTEIDYVIEKISLLISNAINKALHDNYNSTI